MPGRGDFRAAGPGAHEKIEIEIVPSRPTMRLAETGVVHTVPCALGLVLVRPASQVAGYVWRVPAPAGGLARTSPSRAVGFEIHLRSVFLGITSSATPHR